MTKVARYSTPWNPRRTNSVPSIPLARSFTDFSVNRLAERSNSPTNSADEAKFLFLTQVDFIYAQLPQPWFPPPCRPAFQITQVDRSHRARRQPHLLGHPACRRALAGFPHRVLEPFAVRSLAR